MYRLRHTPDVTLFFDCDCGVGQVDTFQMSRSGRIWVVCRQCMSLSLVHGLRDVPVYVH